MDEKTTGAGEFVCLLGNLPYREYLAEQVGPGQLEGLRGVRLLDVDDGRLRFVPSGLELVERALGWLVVGVGNSGWS